MMHPRHVPFSCIVVASRHVQDDASANVLVYNAQPCASVRVDASTIEAMLKTSNMQVISKAFLTVYINQRIFVA